MRKIDITNLSKRMLEETAQHSYKETIDNTYIPE